MSTTRRVLVVSIALIATGSVVGGLCGFVAGLVATAREVGLHGLGPHDLRDLATFTVPFGAIVGAVALPVAGWALLRRAPVGQTILVTAIGTIVGAAVGDALDPINPYIAEMPGVILGGFVGFLIAAGILRFRIGRMPVDSTERAV